MKTLKITKDGQSWIDFEVVGYSVEEKQAIAAELNFRGLELNKFMSKESGSVMSKKGSSEIDRVVKMFAESVPVAPAATRPARRVMSQHYVQMNRIENHGKFWRASLNDVDTGKVPSGLEGEMVCYIYDI